jgi:hypothetical protein
VLVYSSWFVGLLSCGDMLFLTWWGRRGDSGNGIRSYLYLVSWLICMWFVY